MSLASRTEVHRLDSGLCSARGAQEIISVISSRRTVTKLLLGHNDLGDDGTSTLFRFLASQIGRRYPISEISLNSNGIGNAGLAAISQYLNGNYALTELFLQANAFTGDDPSVISIFVEALNSSHVEVLSLTTNHGLGDEFVKNFFPQLHAPYLRELHISSIRLTPRSIPYLTSFIRSAHQCRLQTLKCNGNSLGLRGVKSLIKAIEQNNYSLLVMELYANQRSGEDDIPPEPGLEEEEEEGQDSLDDQPFEAWRDCQAHLSRLCMRNAHLKRQVERQALQLLRYARTLLLHTPLVPNTSSRPSSPSPQQREGFPPGNRSFPFISLPIELQLSILSLLAPSLSSIQRSRIFGYAANPSTLPALLPRLTRFPGRAAGCVPDPSCIGFRTGNWSGGTRPTNEGNQYDNRGSRNTLSCNWEKDRTRWLEAMGCDVYDPEQG